MKEKSIADFRLLFNSHLGLMGFCLVLFAAVFVAFDPGPGGWGLMILLLPMAGCLAVHLFLHREHGHGGHEHDTTGREKTRADRIAAVPERPKR